MGPGAALRRRTLLLAGAAAACTRREAPPPLPPVRWVGARHERGHRLLAAGQAAHTTWPAPPRRAEVLIVGAGIAGLAAARAFMQRGVSEVHVLELDDAPGGNARGHVLGGMACPLGAHYLPLPPPEAHEVNAWLHEIGLLRTAAGRSVPDERHLCHSPQERLFFEDQWVEGLLPPAAPGSARLAQYRRFAARVDELGRGPGPMRRFALPAVRARWDATLAALDGQTFAAWLAREQLDDAALLAHLDYCCRDDYGAGIATVSAWAGVHYFASRHGFGVPGDAERERDAVFTWPEGNAWLVQRRAAPLGARLHTGRMALAVREQRAGVELLAWHEADGHAEAWSAGTVVLAVPLFVAARLLGSAAPPPLAEAAARIVPAPWLVANLHLERALFDRAGAAPAWDNVIHGSAGLGYVDAMHQSLRPHPGATVLTAYHALPAAERPALLQDDAAAWAERVLREIEVAHPDLRQRVAAVELMRWGHAMAVPRPGLARHPALTALRSMRGRVRFAHADLAGYSVFEEAFTAGHLAAYGRAA
jgi:protoporphyrinogen oxidase